MSTRSLSSQAQDVLTDEDKRDDVILYLSKNSEVTSEDLRNLANIEEGTYEKQE